LWKSDSERLVRGCSTSLGCGQMHLIRGFYHQLEQSSGQALLCHGISWALNKGFRVTDPRTSVLCQQVLMITHQSRSSLVSLRQPKELSTCPDVGLSAAKLTLRPPNPSTTKQSHTHTHAHPGKAAQTPHGSQPDQYSYGCVTMLIALTLKIEIDNRWLLL